LNRVIKEFKKGLHSEDNSLRIASGETLALVVEILNSEVFFFFHLMKIWKKRKKGRND